MDREVRFLPYSGRRLAFEVHGSGPPLVVPAWWVGHLELEWQDDRSRGFWQSLGDGYTVVRYDRLGAGLSDRRIAPQEISLDDDVATLLAVVDGLDLEKISLVAGSSGGCTAILFAARHPERVEQLVLYGSYADGRAITRPDLREALDAVVQAHWGVGSRVLADVFLPGADEADRAAFARFQRHAASAETAARLLGLVYRLDVRDALARVRAPTLVVHRERDHAIPYRLGVEVAAGIAGASFASLPGDAHFPWRGDAGSVVRTIRRFLRPDAPTSQSREAPSPLSARELDVLHLAAQGLSDGEIASRLVLSPHTVHRHVANIRRKLGQSSRTAAVAEAARLRLL